MRLETQDKLQPHVLLTQLFLSGLYDPNSTLDSFHTATATRWRCQELLKVKLNNNYTSQNIKCRKKRDLILLNSFLHIQLKAFFATGRLEAAE